MSGCGDHEQSANLQKLLFWTKLVTSFFLLPVFSNGVRSIVHLQLESRLSTQVETVLEAKTKTSCESSLLHAQDMVSGDVFVQFRA